eukprot:Lankesteria_metandrocarpae@DN3448_c0_g1_i1.p1
MWNTRIGSPIGQGDLLPAIKINLKGSDVELYNFFLDKTGVIFGVPGAFTPICSEKHLPGFRDQAKEFKSKVNFLGCLAVNDPYVLKAWARQTQVFDHLTFVADLDGTLTSALGMLHQATNLGHRCRRFAMIIAPGASVYWVGFDEDAFAPKVMSKVDEMLAKLPSLYDYQLQGKKWPTVEAFGCIGNTRQSPINIKTATVIPSDQTDTSTPHTSTPVIDAFEQSSLAKFVLANKRGMRIGMDVTQDAEDLVFGSLSSEGKKYTFADVHFHLKSEHTVDSNHYDMEMHMVYKHKADDCLVVGVFFSEGASNDFLSHFLSVPSFPDTKDSETRGTVADLPGVTTNGRSDPLALNALLNSLVEWENRTISCYRYGGSLTTPPCTECVEWMVCKKVVEASAAQLQKLKSCVDASRGAGNYRLIQNEPEEASANKNPVYDVGAKLSELAQEISG